MTKNFFEDDHTKHVKRIMEGELWEIVETGRDNVKNNRVVDGVTYFDSTEYSSQALNNTANQENGNEWVLVTISRNGKKSLMT